MHPDTHYIFSINTGRSGSDYLAELFDHVDGCRGFHEPDPVGNGKALRHFLRGKTRPMRRLAVRKAARARQIRPGRKYVETNHCFIHGFGWLLPEHLPEEHIGVIVLKRDPERIVSSHLRIGCTPLTRFGRNWIATPAKKSPLVRPPGRMLPPNLIYALVRTYVAGLRAVGYLSRNLFRRRLDMPGWLRDYERACLEWYVSETSALTEAFRRSFPNIRFYETYIEDLNSHENVHHLLRHFGCRETPSLQEVIGRRTNLKTNKSRHGL